MEIFKNIDENYKVGNMGSVLGFNGKPLSAKTKSNGYKEVNLYLDKKGSSKYVHRLVADAFLGGIPTGLCVNHINGIKDDNRLENLEIVTYKENSLHSYRVLGRKPPSFKGEKHPRTKLTRTDVLEIRRLYDNEILNPREIYEEYKNKISLSTTRKICYRSTWKHI